MDQPTLQPTRGSGLQAEPVLTDELLHRMDRPGPRYTSYPTADRFVEAFTAEHFLQALAQRHDMGGAGGAGAPLSLYIHVPFCESVCYYCACNKIVTRDHGRAAAYLDALEHEMALAADALGERVQVSQLHFGGGTPTFLSDEELSRLMAAIRARFELLPKGEFSIEIDPRTVTRQRLAHLRALGLNRVSFGVQDFDAQVQQAVHRIQPFEQVEALMRDARELGFESINADLIYGLPRQTPESFERTVRQVASLRPDRIAMYGYAHLPTRFKPQRRIVPIDLPSGGQRVGMLSQALAGFVSHGYQYIGMDHFALPDDPLAQAKRQGRLHRNFQGYSTQPDCDLIGLGVSAIGKVGATYSQNAKSLEEYQDLLDQGHLPVVRGLAVSRDDLLRRAVIMALMCQGELQFESIELAHLIDFQDYFAAELDTLRGMQDQGLVTVSDSAIQVTPMGWFFVRGVAMVFDKYLQADRTRARFSKII